MQIVILEFSVHFFEVFSCTLSHYSHISFPFARTSQIAYKPLSIFFSLSQSLINLQRKKRYECNPLAKAIFEMKTSTLRASSAINLRPIGASFEIGPPWSEAK